MNGIRCFAVCLVGIAPTFIACDRGESSGKVLGEATIGENGGTLTTESGIELEVPSGAVTGSTKFRITEVAEKSVSRTVLDDDGSELADEIPLGEVAYVLEPSDVTFAQPITLVIPFPPDAVEAEDEVFVVTRQGDDETGDAPIGLGEVNNDGVIAELDHFSRIRRKRVKLRIRKGGLCGGAETVQCQNGKCSIRSDGREILSAAYRLSAVSQRRKQKATITVRNIRGKRFTAVAINSEGRALESVVMKLIRYYGCDQLVKANVPLTPPQTPDGGPVDALPDSGITDTVADVNTGSIDASAETADAGSGDAFDVGGTDTLDAAGRCTTLLTLQPATINLVPDDTAVALGDFNGDTFADAVIPGRLTHKVSLVPGNGNGTFGTPATFSTGVNPAGIAVGLLNDDTFLDVVTSSTVAGASVLLGNGNGTFQPVTSYAAGGGAAGVALGDLNNDGKLDIVTANYTANTISVLLGNGNGTFQTKTDYNGSQGVAHVALARINSDANLDVAVVNVMDSTVGVLLGNGNGSLQAMSAYATDSGPASLVLGDLNADGATDLVISAIHAPLNPSVLSVLLNNGNGTFAAKTSLPTCRFPAGVSLSDLNGDQWLDIAAACAGDDTIAIHRGNGDGTFLAALSFFNGAGTAPQALAIGNLDQTGRPDVFVVTGTDTANVFLGCTP